MIIYTDGSAHPNPGPGGFGVVVLDNNNNLLDCYSYQTQKDVTNNQMELMAILYAFFHYGRENKEHIPILYSDSAYCINVLTNWMFSWAKNGWKKNDNKIPENLKIIQYYFNSYKNGKRVELKKVKGHHNIIWNEVADLLATGKISKDQVFYNYEKGVYTINE